VTGTGISFDHGSAFAAASNARAGQAWLWRRDIPSAAAAMRSWRN
jgi:hypothetical protein